MAHMVKVHIVAPLDPKFESHQCLYAHKYMGPKA